jgi:hypothetical protein
MRRIFNFFKELLPKKYGAAALCSLGFAAVELWSIHRDNKIKGALHSAIFFGCAFLMVFVPLVISLILMEKCRKKEQSIAKDKRRDNG